MAGKAIVKMLGTDKGLLDFVKRVEQFENSYTKVGFPKGSEPGEGNKSFDEVVQIAASHEFGAPKANIPERSFLRSAHDDHQKDIEKLMAYEYNQVADGKSDVAESLGRVGEWFTGEVKAKIDSITAPPFAPSTLKARQAKGDMNPKLLVDTGQMRASVTHVEVIKG